MSKAAYNEKLKDAFDTHLQETERQIGKLEKCFALLAKRPWQRNVRQWKV